MIPADSTIRRALLADAGAIADVHVETWRNTYAGILPDSYLVDMSPKNHASLWTRLLRREPASELILVADDAAAGIVGFVSAGHARKAGLPRRSPYDAEVYTLYVIPDHQGTGLGRALLDAVFAGLVGRGHRTAIVWVLEANPARFFYGAMGGHIVAERTERFAGATLSELAYGWDELAPAAA